MYKNILLATDLSDDAMVIGKKAKKLAEKFEAKLNIVHIVEAIPSYASSYVGIVDVEMELEEEAKKHLAEFATALNVLPQNQFIATGSPKTMILEVSKSAKTDLIIVGSHGLHGISWLLGATASAVAQGANCDVLTIHCGSES